MTPKESDEYYRPKHGSPTFYKLLEEAAELHNIKSHDYASNDNPSGNYHFAGLLSNLFKHSSEDAGFVGRIGEKIYRLANLEKDGKHPKNESIEDTERDIVVITALWITDRRDRRLKIREGELNRILHEPESCGGQAYLPDNQSNEAPPNKGDNPLQTELYDLIKLMPDSQTDNLMEFIISMRQIRRRHTELAQYGLGLTPGGMVDLSEHIEQPNQLRKP